MGVTLSFPRLHPPPPPCACLRHDLVSFLTFCVAVAEQNRYLGAANGDPPQYFFPINFVASRPPTQTAGQSDCQGNTPSFFRRTVSEPSREESGSIGVGTACRVTTGRQEEVTGQDGGVCGGNGGGKGGTQRIIVPSDTLLLCLGYLRACCTSGGRSTWESCFTFSPKYGFQL